MPRPSKLTPEVHETIVLAVVGGNYRSVAAEFAGVNRRTFARWMERGEAAAEELTRLEDLPRAALAAEARVRKVSVARKDTRAEIIARLIGTEASYLALADAVEQAFAEAEVRDIATIEKAAKTQWQAAAWRLERMFPDRFGQRTHRELTGSGGGPIDIRLSHVSDADLDQAIARLEQQG
ncbi:MAG: hypothetical protein ACT4PO_12225 [Actinomycetota bacterium]